MQICCVFSLESPHRGDSNEHTQDIIFNIKKKISLNCPNSAAMGFFQGTQKKVRNSGGKRAISVRAAKVLLYIGKGKPRISLYDLFRVKYLAKFLC